MFTETNVHLNEQIVLLQEKHTVKACVLKTKENRTFSGEALTGDGFVFKENQGAFQCIFFLFYSLLFVEM